jgi:hypothetical protein
VRNKENDNVAEISQNFEPYHVLFNVKDRPTFTDHFFMFRENCDSAKKIFSGLFSIVFNRLLTIAF